MISRTAEIIVRGYHLDVFGVVNNARYLEFLEEGRWTFFDETLDVGGWKERGYSFFVVNININFRRAAVLGDVLEVRTWLSRLGRKSAVAHQEIVLKETGAAVADADVTFVVADSKTSRAVALEGDLRGALESIAELPEDGWQGRKDKRGKTS